MEIDTVPKPFLIVVTGPPGSGKTTLAHALARVIRCPAICRDEIKEGLVNTTGECGTLDGDVAKRTYEVFFDALAFLLNQGITIVAEAAFQHKVWAPKLVPLQEIARMRIILCDIDPKLARSRHIERGLADPDRERFHADPVVLAAREGRETPIGIYEPPRLEVPTLTVDTSDGYKPAVEAIAAFASG